MKVKKNSKPKPRKKIVILLMSVILLCIGFCFLYVINKQDNQKIVIQQENYKKEEENKKQEDELRKELDELMAREPHGKTRKPKTVFEGIEFNYVDEETKEKLKGRLVHMLNGVCQNKEIKEFYKRVDITFIITSNIARLTRENKFPIPKAVAISGADSFYFAGKIPGEKVEQFVILDKTVFDTDMKLLVVLTHESIHARNFVIGIAKKDFFDEEVQVGEQTINSLEDFYRDVNLEKQSLKMAEELKMLIEKERLVVAMFRHNKNLKEL